MSFQRFTSHRCSHIDVHAHHHSPASTKGATSVSPVKGNQGIAPDIINSNGEWKILAIFLPQMTQKKIDMTNPSSVAIPLFHRKTCCFFSESFSSLNSPQYASLQTNIALRSLQARKTIEINKQRNWDFMWFLMIPVHLMSTTTGAVNVNHHCKITTKSPVINTTSKSSPTLNHNMS